MILAARELGVELDYREETASTNDLARDPKYAAGSVVMAERQSAGRGQRGNRWESPAGLNLMFSVVLRPDFLEAENQFYISKIIALAVTDALVSSGAQPRIKWPNDIYIGDRKAAGILIENDLTGPMISRSIAGIGMNVNQTKFDPSLPNPTSLALALGRETDRAGLFKRFYVMLSQRYEQLLDARHGTIDRDYLGRLYRFGGEHLFREVGGGGRSGQEADGSGTGGGFEQSKANGSETGKRRPFAGTIVGVRPAGELQIRHAADNAVRNYLFKEVEYIIDPSGSE